FLLQIVKDAGGIPNIVGNVVKFLAEGFASVLDFVGKIVAEVKGLIKDVKTFIQDTKDFGKKFGAATGDGMSMVDALNEGFRRRGAGGGNSTVDDARHAAAKRS